MYEKSFYFSLSSGWSNADPNQRNWKEKRFIIIISTYNYKKI